MNNANLEKIMVTEKELEEARKILGESAKNMPDNELIDQIVGMKYLTSTWLDEYERSIFEGKTLNEKLSRI